MKSLIAIAMFVTAFAAHAEVKPFGAFVPSLCSYSTKNRPVAAVVAVKSVCVGDLSGMNQDAIKLTLNSGEEVTYLVKFKGNPGGMGITKDPFKGVEQSGTDKISGVLSTTSGITTTYGISLKTKTNLEFQGPLKAVFVTQ